MSARRYRRLLPYALRQWPTLAAILILVLGAGRPAGAAQLQEGDAPLLSPDPRFYQKYFNLQSAGDSLVKKVEHVCDRVRLTNDPKKKNKSLIGIRQKIQDLSRDIHCRQ